MTNECHWRLYERGENEIVKNILLLLKLLLYSRNDASYVYKIQVAASSSPHIVCPSSAQIPTKNKERKEKKEDNFAGSYELVGYAILTTAGDPLVLESLDYKNRCR